MLAVAVGLTMSPLELTRADGIQTEAQYLCDKASNRFEIAKYATRGSRFANPAVEPGFTAIPKSAHIACALTHHTLTAIVQILPPSEAMCMGGGKVIVESLRMGGTELWFPADLAWECDPSTRALMRVRVTDGADSVKLERCYGHTASSETDEQDECKSEKIPMPSKR
jgi:hypothetical protein